MFVAAIAGIGFLPGVGVLVCLEGMFSGELFATENAEIDFLPCVGALVYLESAFICESLATELMLDGIYYKFANMILRHLSLFIRITYWAIEL